MKSRACLVLSFLVCLQLHVAAQQSTSDTGLVQNFYDMSLEQLMGLEVSVASGQSLTTRESPGVVSLITEEEIRSSGARDLMDILRRIPGFDFCVDVEGVVGLAVRGNWAHEGKALLLIDGLEMNENLFSTLQFGNHYPIDNIKRIEIIRGPGSAIYGGNAEYAVINIISKSPADLAGGEAKVSYGQMTTTTGRYNASISAGNQHNDFGYAISMFAGSAIRSDRQYRDFWGGDFDMADNSDLNSAHVNVTLKYKKLQFRGVMDKYTVESKDNYDLVTTKTYPVKFDSYIGELKQDIAITPKFVITPRVNVKVQLPWQYNGDIANDEITAFDIQSSRYTGGINGEWNPSDKINIISGAEYFYDKAQQQGDDVFISTGNRNLDYNNTAVFAQASLKTKIVDITAGARYNYNDRYDATFVPRLSVTRVFDRMHFKLLYSEAYRAPNTENIDLNQDIKPEHTSVIELEAGVKLFPTVYITANLYDITTEDPILFFYDNSTDQDGYRNASKTGTKGVEIDLQWKFKKGYIDLNYGYYSAAGKNSLVENSVPGEEQALLAIPNHQVSLTSNFKFGKKFSINPSMSLLGSKYGVDGINELEEPVINKFDPVLLFNVAFRAEEIVVNGLSAGISLFNILNQEESYMQPYTGGHASLPGPSRELVVNLSYRFLKK